ncbi:hypothetical protein CKO28_04685 [Rhodovibrio sodomensis]|uniref:Cellulose synthase (UDP-forming) n=1 Tax=Rhodovibrio sodomensis TaxID=1088 RepID=A0ABS1DBJ6_9PROT|nr:glycosyltransferase [Rhodovibrio sodomensis]MBK1667324.1 hypothetical protein [Rhodovibrio sodomensis]
MWPAPESFLPLVLAVTFFVILAPAFPRDNTTCRYIVVSALAGVLAFYLGWRFPVTVLPADLATLEGFWVWLVFGIEMLAILDGALLYATLLRRTDRSAEADQHEARLRRLPVAALPTVDVYIPTYDEGLDVLEKTIVGALGIDWPANKLRVWVLDDKRRPWLREFCARKGAGYLTRPDNAHAKAGNINAALKRTDGEFVAIFDADFIPKRTFLYRMMGFFADPKIGIVQAPHNFFNNDPMQANLALRRTLPDDQRLFFDQIMAGRDGWDTAFCCGSNSITRRAALDAVGGALPTDSITEDMLLTLAMLRAGYITRYLNEKLATGLAPESLDAFFVQRARWARGALQILYLKKGPFGPGLPLMKRLLFLPTHWVTQSLCHVSALIVPAVFLLTGLLPLVNADVDSVILYQMPAIVAMMAAMRFFAPGQYFPLASSVLGGLQAFRLLPTVLQTLVRPHGHLFKVTPKGAAARQAGYDRITVMMAIILGGLTLTGLLLNAHPGTRIVESGALIPIVAFWSSFNLLVLLLIAMTAFSAPARRAEERFYLYEPAQVRAQGEGARTATLLDLSLSGAQVALETADDHAKGAWLWLEIADVGEVPAEVVRAGADRLGLRFYLPEAVRRDRLIRKLFTAGLDNATRNEDGWAIALGMLARIFGPDPIGGPARPAPASEPPLWVRAAMDSSLGTRSGPQPSNTDPASDVDRLVA